MKGRNEELDSFSNNSKKESKEVLPELNSNYELNLKLELE